MLPSQTESLLAEAKGQVCVCCFMGKRRCWCVDGEVADCTESSLRSGVDV